MTKAWFYECGPHYLKNVDWSIPDHRRSIAASLVKGVTVLEQDRQLERAYDKALSPDWWEFFDFQCIETLVDQVDASIFGAVFEYNPKTTPNRHYHIPPNKSRPPKYVIAFRGTLLQWLTLGQDIYNDMKVAFNEMIESTRYQISIQVVRSLIAKVNPENVWLAGHSLGAAIALQVGKTMAREGCLIDAYLFNPPYVSIPTEMIASRGLNTVLGTSKIIVTIGLGFVKDTVMSTSTQQNDSFTQLSPWVPYLFVNQNDPLCCEYVGFFEELEMAKSIGLSSARRSLYFKNSLGKLLLGTDGGNCESLHRFPSACVVTNLHPMKNDFKLAHGIQQWWACHTDWNTKRYEFDR